MEPLESLAQHLRQLAISDSGLIFDPMTGHTYSTNETGLTILEALKQECSVSDIVARLSIDYEIDGEDDPARDVEEFLTQLQKHALGGP